MANEHNTNETPAYVPGQLQCTKLSDTRFRLEGNYNSSSTDHFQLIYEALELVAAKDDKFVESFKLMSEELLKQSEDWTE
jgi:hypothetical protein